MATNTPKNDNRPQRSGVLRRSPIQEEAGEPSSATSGPRRQGYRNAKGKQRAAENTLSDDTPATDFNVRDTNTQGPDERPSDQETAQQQLISDQERTIREQHHRIDEQNRQFAKQAAQLERLMARMEEMAQRPLTTVEQGQRHTRFDDDASPSPANPRFPRYSESSAPRNPLGNDFRPIREVSGFSSSSSSRPRLEKIPWLDQKLSNGKDYPAKTWKARITDNLLDYRDYFQSERAAKNYVLDQTEGLANRFLATRIQDSANTDTPQELVDEVARWLTDPAEKERANIEFQKTFMHQKQHFWDFYLEFTNLAATAEITDEERLRNDMRSKILPRLREQLGQKWAETTTFDAWVTAIQNEETNYQSEQTLFSTLPNGGSSRRTRNFTANPAKVQFEDRPPAKTQTLWHQSRNSPVPSSPSGQYPANRQQSSGPNIGNRNTPGPNTGNNPQRSSSQTPDRYTRNAPRNFTSGYQPPNHSETQINEVQVEQADQSADEDDQEEFWPADDQPQTDVTDRETTSRGKVHT